MKENKLKIIINKPIKEVFEFTTNPKNTPRWIKHIKEEKAHPYPPKIGTEYKNRGSSNEWDHYTVTEFEPDKVFTLKSNDNNYNVRYTYKLLSNTKTQMIYHEWTERGKLKNPFTQNVMKELKKLLEEEKPKTEREKKDELENNQESKDQYQKTNELVFSKYIFTIITIFSASLILSLANVGNLLLDNYGFSDFKILIIIFGVLFFIMWLIFASKIKTFDSLGINLGYWALLFLGVYILSIDPLNKIYQMIGIMILLIGFLVSLFCVPAIKNNKIWVFFFIILFISNVGLGFLDSNYGYRPIKSYLNIDGDARNRYSGQNGLECTSQAGRIYIGAKVQCNVNPPLNNITASIKATDLLGETKAIDINRTLEFVAPDKNSKLNFEVWGYNHDQKKVYVTTSFNARFYSVEEDTQRNERFLLGIYGLLALIFISIPQIIKGIKEMAED